MSYQQFLDFTETSNSLRSSRTEEKREEEDNKEIFVFKWRFRHLLFATLSLGSVSTALTLYCMYKGVSLPLACCCAVMSSLAMLSLFLGRNAAMKILKLGLAAYLGRRGVSKIIKFYLAFYVGREGVLKIWTKCKNFPKTITSARFYPTQNKIAKFFPRTKKQVQHFPQEKKEVKNVPQEKEN